MKPFLLVALFAIAPFVTHGADPLVWEHGATVQSAIYGSGPYWENGQVIQTVTCDYFQDYTITEIGIALGTQGRPVTVHFSVDDNVQNEYSFTDETITIPYGQTVAERKIVLKKPIYCYPGNVVQIGIQPDAIPDENGLLVGHSIGNVLDCADNCLSYWPEPIGESEIRDIGMTFYGYENPLPQESFVYECEPGSNEINVGWVSGYDTNAHGFISGLTMGLFCPSINTTLPMFPGEEWVVVENHYDEGQNAYVWLKTTYWEFGNNTSIPTPIKVALNLMLIAIVMSGFTVLISKVVK